MSSTHRFSNCGCLPNWDVRCCCEPNCPAKNTMAQFARCPRAIFTAGFHIENTFELHNDGTKTKAEYIAFIRPTLMDWFSTLSDEAKERTIEDATNLLVDNPDNEFHPPREPVPVDYSKWDLIVSRVADGKCGVCGKILPSSFATVQAVTKHTAELVNLTFCVPCMNS